MIKITILFLSLFLFFGFRPRMFYKKAVVAPTVNVNCYFTSFANGSSAYCGYIANTPATSITVSESFFGMTSSSIFNVKKQAYCPSMVSVTSGMTYNATIYTTTNFDSIRLDLPTSGTSLFSNGTHGVVLCYGSACGTLANKIYDIYTGMILSGACTFY